MTVIIATPANPLARSVMRTRDELVRRQQVAEHQLLMAYHTARSPVVAHLRTLVDRYGDYLTHLRVEVALANYGGDTLSSMRVPPSWLTSARGGNWPALSAQITAQMRTYGRTALGITTVAKGDAVAIGADGAQQAMVAAIAPIAHQLPDNGRIFEQPARDAEARAFVSRAKDGGPLSQLFDGFGPDESAALHDTIVAGLATGMGPRQLASELTQTLDSLSYGRAVTICRTESLHAANSAALANYRANSDIVTSWQWMCAKVNSCAGCLAMDGTIHDLDEDLDDHPNGRCAKAPVTKGYAAILADFGIDASDDDFSAPPWQTYQSGADWLSEQDEATQRAAFGGNAAYLAWKNGDASLSDFGQVRRDRQWGDSIQQASLKSLGLDASDYSG